MSAMIPTRRLFPRVEVCLPLSSTDLATGRSVTLRNLSLGGFQTLSPTPGAMGMRHTFRVRLDDDGDTFDLEAHVVYSHRAPEPSRSFIVGWQALSDPATQANLVRLMAHVAAAATPTSV